MLACAESKDEVLRALKEDVYSQSGIWNWDKVEIHPVCFLTAGDMCSASFLWISR